MTTIKPVDFRSLCCQAEPEKAVNSVWHELTGDGKSSLRAYGVCSKCRKDSEFTVKE